MRPEIKNSQNQRRIYIFSLIMLSESTQRLLNFCSPAAVPTLWKVQLKKEKIMITIVFCFENYSGQLEKNWCSRDSEQCFEITRTINSNGERSKVFLKQNMYLLTFLTSYRRFLISNSLKQLMMSPSHQTTNLRILFSSIFHTNIFQFEQLKKP